MIVNRKWVNPFQGISLQMLNYCQKCQKIILLYTCFMWHVFNLRQNWITRMQFFADKYEFEIGTNLSVGVLYLYTCM